MLIIFLIIIEKQYSEILVCRGTSGFEDLRQFCSGKQRLGSRRRREAWVNALEVNAFWQRLLAAAAVSTIVAPPDQYSLVVLYTVLQLSTALTV